jgi:hypothetical protein
MNMKKIMFAILFLFLFINISYASQITDNYRLQIPAAMSRDWLPEISQDIISIDSIIKMVSTDSAWVDSGANVYARAPSDIVAIGTLYPITVTKLTVSADSAGKDMLRIVSQDGSRVIFGVNKDNRLIVSSDTAQTSVGGVVGRITVISSDGTVCYIPLYSAS